MCPVEIHGGGYDVIRPSSETFRKKPVQNQGFSNFVSGPSTQSCVQLSCVWIPNAVF